MVNNSVKLDRRTKQHTEFGVSVSNSSRDMAQTKVAKKKKNERRQSHKASPTGIANESGERLLDMCVEQELAIGNSFFKKKWINKYTWIRVANGRVIETALMDYVLVRKRMVGRLKDVFRGVAAGMSDHFSVKAKVVVAKE